MSMFFFMESNVQIIPIIRHDNQLLIFFQFYGHHFAQYYFTEMVPLFPATSRLNLNQK